jgi:hypothetical protein
MATVLHFATGEPDKAACGARIILCSDYTDDRRYVDCGRCKRTKQFAGYDPSRFNVDVWNSEGDVVDWCRGITAEALEDIREKYADEPGLMVEVTDALPEGH